MHHRLALAVCVTAPVLALASISDGHTSDSARAYFHSEGEISMPRVAPNSRDADHTRTLTRLPPC